METEAIRNTIGPMLPASIRETVIAELEQRDREIARLSNEHDQNLQRIMALSDERERDRRSMIDLWSETTRLRLRLERMTRLQEATNKLIAGLPGSTSMRSEAEIRQRLQRETERFDSPLLEKDILGVATVMLLCKPLSAAIISTLRWVLREEEIPAEAEEPKPKARSWFSWLGGPERRATKVTR